MNLPNRLLAILESRALSALTLLALLLVGVGIAAKWDAATAAIVVGVIILLDLELTTLKGASS